MNMSVKEAAKEWHLLCDHIASMKKVAVSFSGGVDSTVVLAAAVKMLPNDHIAVFADIPTLSERQRNVALEIAKELKSNVTVAGLCWECMPGVRENTSERCYHCKKAIYSAVRSIATDNRISICVDGENSSDNADERPGRRAAAELGIVSPLKDLGLGRNAVKKMFAGLRLNINVQKETCMATRYSEGVPLDDDKIRFIAECEDMIRSISGVRQIRMRMRNGHAGLVTSPDEIALLRASERELSSALFSKGIPEIRIDAKGYRE